MKNKDVAQILEHVSLFLELKGENPFKVRAYQRAARAVETAKEDIQTLHEQGKLTSLSGIGKSIAEDIAEFIDTARIGLLEEMEADFPKTIMELFRVPGLGAKRIKTLYENLDIGSLGELEYSCLENRLVDLPGFGKRTQENILANIDKLKRYRERRLRSDCESTASEILHQLRDHPDILRASLAGSMRRGLETVKDIDLVAATEDGEKVADWFSRRDFVDSIIGAGATKVSVTLKSGVNLDLRLVGDREFPFALQYLTGSKIHNETLRGIAKRQGLKLNEYGLFHGEKSLACTDEEAIYKALGLAYIDPELRENMGEIEAAEEGKLPTLITKEDIRGTFHAHTFYSDGVNSMSELAAAARDLGLSYLGISEHSQSAYYANGLKPDKVKEQRKEIDEYNRAQRDFKIFFGIESDITAAGGLDYEDEILDLFDYVIASVHSQFTMDQEAMTGRILRVLENPYTTMLGHPTGRLLLAREPYAVDMRKVIRKAAETGVVIEHNANPHRLDLDWRLMPMARELGVKISINPDAHNTGMLADVFYGVATVRKGWMEAGDVINTMNLQEMEAWIEQRRKRSK